MQHDKMTVLHIEGMAETTMCFKSDVRVARNGEMTAVAGAAYVPVNFVILQISQAAYGAHQAAGHHDSRSHKRDR